jgi:hypothetical protein
MNPQWLDFAQRIQAIAQTGLSYQPQLFDAERYHQLLDIAAEMTAAYSDAAIPQLHSLYDSQAGHATPKVDVRGVVFRGLGAHRFHECSERPQDVAAHPGRNDGTGPSGYVLLYDVR